MQIHLELWVLRELLWMVGAFSQSLSSRGTSLTRGDIGQRQVGLQSYNVWHSLTRLDAVLLASFQASLGNHDVRLVLGVGVLFDSLGELLGDDVLFHVDAVFNHIVANLSQRVEHRSDAIIHVGSRVKNGSQRADAELLDNRRPITTNNVETLHLERRRASAVRALDNLHRGILLLLQQEHGLEDVIFFEHELSVLAVDKSNELLSETASEVKIFRLGVHHDGIGITINDVQFAL